MVARLKDGREEREKRLQYALHVVGDEAINLDDLKKKIAASKTTWLVADLAEGLAGSYEAPPVPAEFTVMASDGSHIDVDRHQSTRCYLINIGSAVLKYSVEPDASLESYPRLYSDADDMVIKPVGSKGREQLVEGALLGIKRAVEECRQLADVAVQQPPGSTSLALLDGTLILWGLEAYPEFVAELLLDKGFLSYLEGMRKLNNDRKLALASYISFPRSTDVVNVLRVAICPHKPVDCDYNCPPDKARVCDQVDGVRDRELFFNLLNSGERSALFISPSKIVKERYGLHHVYFFYVRVDDEGIYSV